MGSKNRNRNFAVATVAVEEINGLLETPVTEIVESEIPAIEPVTETVEPVAETKETESIEVNNSTPEPKESESGSESSDPVIVNAVKKATVKKFEMPSFSDDGANFDLARMRSDLTVDADVQWKKFDQVYSDLDFNVRDKEDAYTHDALKGLRTNVETFGLEEALEVSLQKDGRLKIVRGNRRYHVMVWQREDHLAAVEAGTAKLSDLPWKKVPVKIHENMTYEAEIARMLDHGNRQPLNNLELFNAVQRLVTLGWGETRILNHLGQKRGKIHAHWEACTLPPEVTELYVATLKDKKASVKVGSIEVGELKKAWNEDLAKAKTNPRLIIPIGGGDKFKETFTKLKADALVTRPAQSRSVLTIVEAELAFAQSHHILNDYINALLGRGEESMLNDSRTNLIMALQTVFPIEKVKQIEEGVTKELNVQIPAE